MTSGGDGASSTQPKWARLTKDQRWAVADALARDVLPRINATARVPMLRPTLYARFGKRIIDIILSSIALVITFPINVIIGVITFFDVGRPIFFKQVRTGRNGKPFTILKFRNMRNTRDAHGDLLPPAQRVTKWGRFVRATSLDELLNFVSIFKGDMSFIGPRPLLPEYEGRYSARHHARLLVRPGLECPPRDVSHVWTWNEQFENDVWYVEHLSFTTDCKMLWYFLRFVFNRKNATARSQAQRGVFMGYDETGRAIVLSEVPERYIDAVLKDDVNAPDTK